MFKGLAVSPGVAIGTAYCIDQIFVPLQGKRLADQEITAELARYEAARDRTSADLRALHRKVASQLGEQEAAIFAVHEAILRDNAFTRKIRGWIVSERMTAQVALARLLDEYTQLFSRGQDEYLQDRLADLRDVVLRLSTHLSEVLRPETNPIEGPLIVVSDELLPSQAVSLGQVDVHGIVTQKGGQTSHAAIIARGRGIPAVSGVPEILQAVETGDCLIVDGRTGHILVNPDTETLTAYRKLEREYRHLRTELATNRDEPAQLADGTVLQLLANINNAADAKAACAMGATGVGLFRTEYLYLTHPDVPDEEEQYAAYVEIVEACPRHQATIRTLDIGGDKTIPYLGHRHQEANPFMGWRSIRLSFEHPEFFATQIRAILRAGYRAHELGGEVRIMFPMVTTVEELRQLRRLVARAGRQLSREGKPFHQVPLGMMLEVPAAAIFLDAMLPYVEFVSVGSNDLVQYLMAADRDNPKVSHLCQPLSPAVLRVLRRAIRLCNKRNKPITLCGEMAGQLRSFLFLAGLGLRSFSMSPAFLPTIKDLARHVSVERCEALVAHAIRLRTTAEVKSYLGEQLHQISPELAMLDMD